MRYELCIIIFLYVLGSKDPEPIIIIIFIIIIIIFIIPEESVDLC